MAEPSTSMDTTSRDLDDVVRVGKAVGDQLRSTILALLKADSLSVSELCAILEVPQPALSHHLKILLQAGLLARRREGTSLFYRRNDNAQAALRQAVFHAIDEVALAEHLHRGLSSVHEQRRAHCQSFFAANAPAIASLQTQIAEPAAYTDTVLDMAARLTPKQRALEVGPGNGELLRDLAADYAQVCGVDSSVEMLAETARVTATTNNITLLHSDFLSLDSTEQFDLIVAAMAVHHLPSPAAFFDRARALLAPGGSIIVAELTRHDQHWASEVCGDLWLGFEPGELQRWAQHAGLHNCESQFLAQKNGFQIQVQRYVTAHSSPINELSQALEESK